MALRAEEEERAFDVLDCRSESDWLAARLQGITGSDAPALWAAEIAELSGGEETFTWSSPYSIWCEKLGLLDGKREETEPMYWGKVLEPHIADRFERDQGGKFQLVDLGRNALLVSRERPYLRATIDRMIAPIDELGPGDLEIKSTEDFHLSAWSDGPPRRVWTQVQHQLAVTGWRWAWTAALIGKRGCIYYPVARDDEWIELHLERVDELWERVQSGIAPPTDGTDATARAIARRFRAHQARFKPLPDDPDQVDALRAAHAQMRDAQKDSKAAKDKRDEAENFLADAIGDALGIEGLVQWQIGTEGNVSWKGACAFALAMAGIDEPAAEALALFRGEPTKKLVDFKPPRQPRGGKR